MSTLQEKNAILLSKLGETSNPGVRSNRIGVYLRDAREDQQITLYEHYLVEAERLMAKQHLFGSMVEIDEVSTRRWYADAEEWGCDCGDCRNFLSLARKRQLPAFVLEQLDKLGIPPEKATYVCQMCPDGDGQHYQFSYRIAGNILSREAMGKAGRCCHEPHPYGAPGFPEPHFDLEFWVTLPWVLGEPGTGPQKEGVSS